MYIRGNNYKAQRDDTLSKEAQTLVDLATLSTALGRSIIFPKKPARARPLTDAEDYFPYSIHSCRTKGAIIGLYTHVVAGRRF
jgi:hypothetical protein